VDDTDDRSERAVNELLRELEPGQDRLLRLIAESFLKLGRWPYFDYVDGVLEGDALDARSLLASLPRWAGSWQYGLVWAQGSAVNPRVDQEIALTVAGLARCRPEADALIDAYLSMLRFLDDRRRAKDPHPMLVRKAEVSVADLMAALGTRGVDAQPPSLGWQGLARQLRQLVEHEPGVRGALELTGSPDSDNWACSPQSDLRPFGQVTSVEGYLHAVADIALPPASAQEPAFPSSLGLPEAIDFLDAVWRLHFDDHLFQLPGARKTEELGLDSATTEEFESRVSALADLIARLKVAGAEKILALDRLKEFLPPHLPDNASRARVEAAIRTLRRINHVRRGGQHQGAADVRTSAFQALGIPFPPDDWGSAWASIQARAVEAFNAIREEIQAAWP
jgi:hypothetical protein